MTQKTPFVTHQSNREPIKLRAFMFCHRVFNIPNTKRFHSMEDLLQSKTGQQAKVFCRKNRRSPINNKVEICKNLRKGSNLATAEEVWRKCWDRFKGGTLEIGQKSLWSFESTTRRERERGFWKINYLTFSHLTNLPVNILRPRDDVWPHNHLNIWTFIRRRFAFWA